MGDEAKVNVKEKVSVIVSAAIKPDYNAKRLTKEQFKEISKHVCRAVADEYQGEPIDEAFNERVRARVKAKKQEILNAQPDPPPPSATEPMTGVSTATADVMAVDSATGSLQSGGVAATEAEGLGKRPREDGDEGEARRARGGGEPNPSAATFVGEKRPRENNGDQGRLPPPPPPPPPPPAGVLPQAPPAAVPAAPAGHLMPLDAPPPPPPAGPLIVGPLVADRPGRPVVGLPDKPVRLLTNFVRTIIKPGSVAYQCDIAWYNTAAAARQEGDQVPAEIDLPAAKRQEAIIMVEEQLRAKYGGDHSFPTDYKKQLLCDFDLCGAAGGVEVVHVPELRVWLRITATAARMVRLDSDEQVSRQAVDILLRADLAKVRKTIGLGLFEGGHEAKRLSQFNELLFGIKTTTQNGFLIFDGVATTVKAPVKVARFLIDTVPHSWNVRDANDLADRLRDQARHAKVQADLEKEKVTCSYGRYLQHEKEYLDLTRLCKEEKLTPKQARERYRPGQPANNKAITQSTRTIKGLGQPADETSFVEESSGRQWTVTEWFAEKEGVPLRYPKLQCLLFGKGGKNAVPMELCTLAGGTRSGVLTADERRQVVQETSAAPADRKQQCDDVLETVKGEVDSAKAFGVEIGEQVVINDARQLSCMPLVFGGGQTATPNGNGHWNLFQGRNEFKFVEPGQIDNAYVLNCVGLELTQQLEKTVFGKMYEVAHERGMVIRRMGYTDQRFQYNLGQRNLEQVLEENAGRLGKGDLLFAVLPDQKNRNGQPIYQQFKGWCFSKGLPSQVLLISKMKSQAWQAKNLQSYVNNLLLKVNPKMGGINWRPSGLQLLRDRLTLVVGLDVHHPPPGAMGPSYVAACAYFLLSNGKQHVYTVQRPHAAPKRRAEIVPFDQMESIFTELLQHFHKTIGCPLDRVIFLRDGVAHSQFEAAHLIEIQGVRAAFEKQRLHAELVVIVAQKRNSARFFAAAEGGGVIRGQEGAPRPGTTVDTTITSPHSFDYYQQGAHALKGTPHPVHYHVLLNEAGLLADEVEKLTFELCHVYARCTKTVSQPAPLMYADLAAEKASFLVPHFREESARMRDDSSSGASTASTMREVPDDVKDRLSFI